MNPSSVKTTESTSRYKQPQLPSLTKAFSKKMKNRVSVALSIAVILFCVTGCNSHTWVDVWQPISVPKGLAWHNAAYQQTAFDIDSDGRIDRLRFWIGSGLAEELMDTDLDGWFDSHVVSAYGKDREQKQIHTQAPAVPVANAAGAFERPRDQ
ncbi:hypothetical protein [Rariglobus hedericola]|uniref:Uncharacterized protein n=1 Tax=Rariglobus hedericola TaxID=2597822 RepID=A0A556QM89_9BACT|nr:hypothetical protein [Rariglobus hedericola]TSJ77735.1 hypothetical protein FPL22_00040 [Rariglobus hedericola]